MIVIQDQIGTHLVMNGTDMTITTITHQQFIDELNALSTNLNMPLLDMMGGNVPKIGVQLQNRGVAQLVAQLVGAGNINCVQQYGKVGCQGSTPAFVYVIQPTAVNGQVQNFQRDTLIYKCRLTRSPVVQQ